MQNNKSFDIVGTTILVGGLGFCLSHIVRDSKQQQMPENPEISTTITLNKLKLERDSVNDVAREYKDKRNYSVEQQEIYKNSYKTYDDMDSLYLLSRKLYLTMNQNYSVAQQDFEKKIAKIGKRFCKKNGKYVFTQSDAMGKPIRVAWKPVDVTDWLIILEENKDKIPNYKQIQYENAVLDNIGGVLYGFSEFLKNDFKQYVKTSKSQKNKDKKTLVLSFDGKMNTVDNVNQDKILNVLINDYMNKFIVFDQNKQMLDKDLYANIMQIALSVKKHNEIESDVVTCDEEYTKTLNVLDSIKNEITELRKVR